MNSSAVQAGGPPTSLVLGLPAPSGARCPNCGAPVTRTTQTCPGCGVAVQLRSEFLAATDPAVPRRRLLATVLDWLLPLGVVVALLLLSTPSSAVRWSSWGVLAAWVAVLVVTEGVTGRTPGKALLGLRVVDVRTGRVIGIGPSALRMPTKLAAAVATLGFAGFSYRWDPDGQERTWWDHAARSRVIDAAVQIPGGTGRVPGVAAGTVDAVAARWAPAVERAPLVTGVPASPGAGSAGPTVLPTVPLGSPAPHPGRPTEPPQRLSVSPNRQPSARPTAPPNRQPSVPPTVPPPSLDPDAERRGRHTAPDAAPRSAGRGHPGVPPGPPGALEDPAAETATAAGLQEPTRVHRRDELASPARVPGRSTTATLQWDTGARVVVGGTVLIGRDPVADDGEKVDRRLAVGKDSVGVSKTHLLLSITTSGVTVTDRHSTNGVRIEHEDGTAATCRPDLATTVRSGDIIRFGGRSITLPDD